jgi:glutathione S-transferase
MSYLGVEYQNLAHDDPEHEREWRSLTHAKTVPVLVDGDLVLTDSPVMLEYLQDLHGGLLPADPGDRARVRSLVQYADKNESPPGPGDSWALCRNSLSASETGSSFQIVTRSRTPH